MQVRSGVPGLTASGVTTTAIVEPAEAARASHFRVVWLRFPDRFREADAGLLYGAPSIRPVGVSRIL